MSTAPVDAGDYRIEYTIGDEVVASKLLGKKSSRDRSAHRSGALVGHLVAGKGGRRLQA